MISQIIKICKKLYEVYENFSLTGVNDKSLPVEKNL